MKLYSSLWILLCCISLFSCCKPEVKIACVGDSITEGNGIADEQEAAYPALLGKTLGEGYSVINLGCGGTTALKNSNFSYWTCNEFSNVFSFQPDIIIIQLGTNDTKPQNWDEAAFVKDYQALIDTFQTMISHPIIVVCKPVPVFRSAWGINDSTLKAGVIPVIEKIANTNNLQMIDLYHPLKNQPENFPDGIHPNEVGLKNMSTIIGNELKTGGVIR
jgi:acyl-CoA thioesterase I